MVLDISAETLYKKSNSYEIRNLIDQIYQSIACKIYEAKRAGLSEITYELPDNISASGLELADLQLIVYANIIEKLREKRLKVGLYYQKGTAMLMIRWPSVLDPREKERYKNILKSAIEESKNM